MHPFDVLEEIGSLIPLGPAFGSKAGTATTEREPRPKQDG
jgi:hypothetical protein